MSGRVAIVGSANVDLVHTVARIPAPGETVTAETFERFPGGKGLNQAIAASRAGAPTSFIGAIGGDEHGAVVRQALTEAGIETGLLRQTSAPTGTAMVTLDASGENNIVILPGANALLRELSKEDTALIAATAVLVCQLEVPDSVILEAAIAARTAGAMVILNPAPVRNLPPELLDIVDVLIVNEHEAKLLNADRLRVPYMLTTLGSQGVLLVEQDADPIRIPARRTIALDTTGAGDTFVGVFAAGLAAGNSAEGAARRATVAASLSVESKGAVPSIPTRRAVDDALQFERVEKV